MRGLALLSGIIAALVMTLRYPFVGILLWTWFTLQNPHQEAYGFVRTAPINLIIALVTVIAWFASRERKVPPTGLLFWLLVAFLAWMTFNSFFAFDPAWSWQFWDRTWKTFALGLMIAAMATSRTRIYALLWIIVISLFYFGVKGGIFTIVTGGHFHVNGPPSTIISDNNQLAVALLMTLPLANYLRVQVADKRIGMILLVCIILTVVAILGTYSRGAVIGLGALGLFMVLRTRNRLLYLAIAGVLVVFAFNFMPAHFFHRMDTIHNAQKDASFEGRLFAWQVAYMYARDHFPFGAGFYGPQLAGIFHHYFPDQLQHAAHSIYFQVLGEHGFIGLGLYLMIIATALIRCSMVIRAERGKPERQWAVDLAVAIQASLVVFCIAGAALSMAYYDLFVIEVALLLPIRELCLRSGGERLSWAQSMAAQRRLSAEPNGADAGGPSE